MCEFFSFCSDEYGKKYYFDWEQRVKMKHEGVDSHDHIIAEYKLKDSEINCFEFNPLTKKFEVDKINTIDNRVQAEEWVNKLDFKKIVEPLIVKPFVNPLTGRAKKPTPEQIQLLKDWASVLASVGASVLAYTSTFFDIKYKHNFTPAIKLWDAGFVSSFDGKTWRLHSGKSAKIVYTLEAT